MMLVPESFRYVIILAIINIQRVIAAPADSTSRCRIVPKTILDCSNLGLAANLPNDIPNTILTLNLSFNEISHLTETSFGEGGYGHIEVLDLSNNIISSIHRKAFKNFVNLTRLTLRENEIDEFDSQTFADLAKLETLDLSYNSIKLQDSFLIQSNLKELLMDHCNIDEFPNEAFLNVSQLESLSLKGNSFENFDASPFAYLSSLTVLRMHNIPRSSVEDLCRAVQFVDTINFDGYNMSCFLLVAQDHSNIEQAVVGIEPPLHLPVLHITTTKPPTTTTTSTTTFKPLESLTDIPIMNHTGLEQTLVPLETTTKDDAVVDVDKSTIQYMLIGILAVTLMGFAIGLICRADVLGIKTKMCRSSKNRRKPEDSVSPFEEIPLNTVNSNGNEKSQVNNN